MKYGTSHFVSLQHAIAYYQDYERNARAAVNRKLRAGEIHIGKPALKPGERLELIDNGCRYAIVEG